MQRPSVSVIVPFAGSDADFEACLLAMAAVELGPEDELIIADNRPRPDPRALDAAGPPSSYFARQLAAQSARGEWLLFLDADTLPDPGILTAYFDPAPAANTGILAGAIEDWIEADTPTARYIARRRKLDQATTLAHAHRPYAQTANAAFRRSVFEAADGFNAPVRSGGDADLCWRLLDDGWEIEERPAARVRHRNRATLGALLAQLHRHGSGMMWLERRYPGSFPPPHPRELFTRTRLLAGGRDAAIDFLGLWARDLGRLKSNGDPTRVKGSTR